MDTFKDSVVSQTTYLNVCDTVLSSFNIQLIFFYENEAGADNFMDSTKLEQAFYRTLVAFPSYAGVARTRSDGRLELVIDRDNLNMPVYRVSESDVPFGDLKAAKYNPKSWPPGLMTVAAIPLPDAETGVTKMLNAHVVRCKDNSGVVVYVCGHHIVADGNGMYTFVRRWADEMRALVEGTPGPDYPLNFDRSSIFGPPSAESMELSEIERKNLQSFFSTSLNEMCHKEIVDGGYDSNLYRINRADLDNLRRETLEFVPGGTRLSTNDVLTALMSKTLAWAVKDSTAGEAYEESAPADEVMEPPLQSVAFAYNIRPVLGESFANYIGNGLYIPSFTHPFDSSASAVTAQSLAEMAIKVRNSVDAVEKHHVQQFFASIEGDPKKVANTLAHDNPFKHTAILTNHFKLRVYEINFGFGVATFVAPRPYLARVCVRILPVSPPSNDIYVFINDTPAVLDSVRKNKFWNGMAELVY